MTNYERGARLERDTKARLENDGWDAIRAAGSHGIVDLVAFKRGVALFIQCKVTDPLLSPADRAELIRVAATIDGLPLVAYRDRGVRFRLLNGPGPREWVPWTPDEIGESA